MLGYDEPLLISSSPMMPDQLTTAITDLARSVAATAVAIGRGLSTTGFPYGMPGYGMTLLPGTPPLPF
jgi:hypothetical protein